MTIYPPPTSTQEGRLNPQVQVTEFNEETRQLLTRLQQEDEEREQRLNHPNALHRAAHWYARHGIPVFPLKPGGKQPLHPTAHRNPTEQRACRGRCGRDGHGLHDATTNPDTITRWWTQTPNANIGIRTGVVVDVVDVDGPQGLRTYAHLIRHGACPKHPDGTPSCCDHQPCPGDGGVTLHQIVTTVYGVVWTAGDNGGKHLYVPPTGGGNTTSLLPHIDYRGRDGYVVAPPSRGRRGQYRWVQPLTLPGVTP